MLIRGIAVSTALLAFAPDATAGEQSALLRRASCSVVRYYVTKYSASAAEVWARSHGVTDAEIEAARRCLKDMPQALQTAHLAGH